MVCMHQIYTFYTALGQRARRERRILPRAFGQGDWKAQKKNLRRISNVQSISEHSIADKIIDSEDAAFGKRVFLFQQYLHLTLVLAHFVYYNSCHHQNSDELLAQSKSMRRAAGIGPQASPPLDLGKQENPKMPLITRYANS